MGIDMEWMCAYGGSPWVLIWGGCVHMVEVYKEGVFLGKR